MRFSGRRTLLISAAALLLIIILTGSRVATVSRLRDQGFFDKYPHFAKLAASGTLAPDRFSDVSPAYLGLVALLHARSGMTLEALRSLQITMVSLAAAACGAAAAWLAGPVAGVSAAIFLLGSRAALVNATEYEPETLALLANSIAVLGLAGWGKTRRTAWLIAGALALGVSAITRPTAVLILLVVSLWLASRRRLIPGILFLAAGTVPIVILLGLNRLAGRSPVIMDPGTVFYEGMNPLATGYAGVQPRIVNDLERETTERDALHLTYRHVASRASGRTLSKGESNRYWTSKAIHFMQDDPQRAIALTARKLRLAVSSYEGYDLSTMVRKDWELQRQLWIPFTTTLALALLGTFLRREISVPFGLFALAASAPLLVFYVTARQRNALLPPLAVLAGLGVGAMVRAWYSNRRLALSAALLAAVATVAGSVPGPVQREDRHAWESHFAAEELRARARGGTEPSASVVRAHAATWLTAGEEIEIPAEAVRAAAMTELKRARSASRIFDLAVVLARAGETSLAGEILERLAAARYRPIRDTRAPSSVAYHQAVVQRRSGRDINGLIARALREAPGDADVLALQLAATGDESIKRRIDRLHDPFSRDLALAEAYAITGRAGEAMAHLDRLRSGMPEWQRVEAVRRRIGGMR